MKKKAVLSTILVIACLILKGQSPDQATYYVGKTLIVLDFGPSAENVYMGFVKDINNSSPDSNRALFYNTVKGQRFKCIGAGAADTQNQYLKLQNELLGVVYYKYRNYTTPQYMNCVEDRERTAAEATKAAAEASDMSVKKLAEIKKRDEKIKNPCLTIEKSYDEFHNITTFSTPGISQHVNRSSAFAAETSEFYNVLFFKNLKNTVVTYQCYLTTTALNAAAYVKGVIILLQNGRKINKPGVVVETRVNSSAEFVRSATFYLDAADRALLKTSPIKGFELYDVQSDVVRPDEIYNMFTCLLDKKI